MKTPKTCPRCGKVFLHRGNLNNHLRKQKICKSTYIDGDREDIIQNYDKYHEQYLYLLKKEDNKVKGRYKLKVKKEEIDNEPTIETLDEYDESYIQPIQNNNNYDSNQMMAKLNEIINNLSQNIKPNNTNVATEGSNILNDNSKQLNQHFNITVNTFGNEDLSHITRKEWHDIIKKNINAIPELTKKIYIDEEKNRNVFLTSPKDGYCKVYTDDGWKYKGTKDIVHEIIGTNADRIYDYMDAQSNKDKPIYKRMTNVIDRLGDDNSMVLRKNVTDIKELFINYPSNGPRILE